jgi:thiosulfate/3-mercaptopyruvate sulfurtransferase
MRSCRVAFVIALSACVPGAAQQTTASRGRLVSGAEVAARLEDPALVILHVVDRYSPYETAHIPGARPVRYDQIAVDGAGAVGAELPPAAQLERVFEEAGVSDNSRVVIYGSTTTAARVFFTLDASGHRDVSLLDGGLRAWQADGRPVATGPASTSPRGAFTPKIDHARIATAELIQAQSRGIALVDVRPDAEYTGEDDGMGMHPAGHIEGARQLPWNELVGPDGRFLPEAQLRARLAAAGAAPGKPIVAYCMVGLRASVVYFVARHLGLDARLYDGSIVDWGRRQLPTRKGR